MREYCNIVDVREDAYYIALYIYQEPRKRALLSHSCCQYKAW
jgi:hypothetical protein